MKREITFRAWDGKTMNYSPPISTYDASVNDEFYYSESGQSKLTFNQYSGLKDKNEKEIFEGDIIHFKANYSSKRNGWLKGIVIYDENNYYKLSIKVGYDIYEVGEETDEFPYTCEVLGNIYESPSLLI